MKKFISGLLIGSILSFSTVAFADNPIKIFVNNKQIDTQVISQNGITYVPLRTVSENLGASVQWDGATNSVKINNGQQPQQSVVSKPTATQTTQNNLTINEYGKIYINGMKDGKYEKVYNSGLIKVQYGNLINNFRINLSLDIINDIFPEYSNQINSNLSSFRVVDYQGKKYVDIVDFGSFLNNNGQKWSFEYDYKDGVDILINDNMNKYIGF